MSTGSVEVKATVRAVIAAESEAAAMQELCDRLAHGVPHGYEVQEVHAVAVQAARVAGCPDEEQREREVKRVALIRSELEQQRGHPEGQGPQAAGPQHVQ